MSGGLTD